MQVVQLVVADCEKRSSFCLAAYRKIFRSISKGVCSFVCLCENVLFPLHSPIVVCLLERERKRDRHAQRKRAERLVTE